MWIEENLRGRTLFADAEWEERFREALDREIREGEDFAGSFREVLVSDPGPESIAAVLASLISKIPVLLVSDSWGRWTREAFESSRNLPVASGSVLIRTGGSSGRPKFAVHSWESLEAAGKNLWKHLGEKPLSSELNLPLHHVSGWMPVVRALVSGGRIFRGWQERDLPGLVLRSVVPTTLYRALIDPEKREILRKTDRIFAGGAAFSDELLARAREDRLPLSLVYGMTETAAMIAMQEPPDFWEGRKPRVKTLPGNRISIGEGGEILVESDQLFSGYLGQPPRKERVWPTGDSGELDARGRLSINGRMGRFMVCGGETISLEKVERLAGELRQVSEALAMAVPDPEWGERLILYLVVDREENRDWRGELRGMLDPAEIPAEVRIVREIPRNGAGKVDPDRLFG